MPLASGYKLGSYEIVSPLGAGGMGEVYRARDSKLKREVAIKVLPTDVANDRERLARFQREAEVLASLNHPNIAHVYGIEENASTGPGQVALVMELVEGEDLSQRISRGPIPIVDALAIAQQIAEALEAAHDAGIIHRDLKPANIKVREDGTVKVLDFGLAKALEQGSGIGDQRSGALANSPTITSPAMTMRGVILGTAAYMSPEQAKGKAVDKRADIWAFGCVLFEMLTGKRAFKGDDVTDIITSVMRDTPDWAALPRDTSASIRRLLRRCLEKDPRRRAGHMSIVRLECDDDSTPAAELVRPTATAAASRRTMVVAIASTVAALAMGWSAGRYLGVAAPPADSVQFAITPPDQVQFFRQTTNTLAVAPDGKSLAYVAIDAKGTQALWLYSFHDGSTRMLPNTTNAASPFWSADGSAIAFQAERKLHRVDAVSGAIQTICDCAFGRGTWNRDNVILISNGITISRVPAGGGTPDPITKIDEGAGVVRHTVPQFLPDGRHFLFSAESSDTSQSTLQLGELGSLDTRTIGKLKWGATYVEPGELIYATDGPLMIRGFDLATASWRGEPRVVANRVRQAALGSAAFGASPNGTVVFDPSFDGGHADLTWFNRDGSVAGGFAKVAGFHAMALAANDRVAAVEILANTRSATWLIDSLRGTRTRLTFEDTQAQGHPVWSPDMSQIAYFSGYPGRTTTLMLKGVANTSNAVPLLGEVKTGSAQPTDWSADGRFVIYEEQSPKSSFDLHYIALAGDRKPVTITATPFAERQGRLSPDGKYLAYTSNESGRREVLVLAFPDAARRWTISNQGGSNPVWRHDGRELVFLDEQDTLMSVAIAPGAEFTPGVPTPLFPAGAVSGDGGVLAFGRDGRLLIARASVQVASTPLRVVLNVTRLGPATPQP
jgi:dipeptidyl aminopeptidase/acylaminoacyl peptidase